MTERQQTRGVLQPANVVITCVGELLAECICVLILCVLILTGITVVVQGWLRSLTTAYHTRATMSSSGMTPTGRHYASAATIRRQPLKTERLEERSSTLKHHAQRNEKEWDGGTIQSLQLSNEDRPRPFPNAAAR